ncbi:DNA helicase [Naganishia albida]|nr:DNA helicase [Naganishia albida]
MGKPKTPEEERAAAARREAIMKAFSQTTAQKVAPRLSDVSTSSSTRSSNAIDQMLSGMDTGTSRKRDTSLAPWAGDDNDRDSDWMPGNMAAKKSGKLNKVFLSIEQQQVLGMVLNQGKNIFFTGSAGTGKSVLLREIIAALRKKFVGKEDSIAVTASTGMAACNIGGMTVHSFAGIGLGTGTVEHLCSIVRKNKKALNRWLKAKVLVIDEVSMVDGELFDKLNRVGQKLRKKTQPFGGIQLVVTGDFFQLPPVNKGGEPNFVFEAETWKEAIHKSINLTKVFRQRDETFVRMLNEMRFGTLTAQSIARFESLRTARRYDDGIEPTSLYPTRKQVDAENERRLKQLPGEGRIYRSKDGPNAAGGAASEQQKKLLENFMAPGTIVLKIDAQVMMIKNLDDTLVNGSMGRVIGFCRESQFQMTSTGSWKGKNGGLQDEDFEDGADDEERSAMAKARSRANPIEEELPVVSFMMPGGGVRDFLVKRETFKTTAPNDEILAQRSQLPLILAWAMSIHKSQGQTLERVKVDLGSVFEKGQAYVALSRATSLEGLQILGFSRAKVMAHPKVKEWSRTLVTTKNTSAVDDA